MAQYEDFTILVGNVGRDPELSSFPDGTPKLEFGLVRNDRRKDGDQWVDGPAQWFNVSVTGKDATNYSDSLAKGNRVVVIGEIKYREWEKDGQKRNAISVRASEIALSARWATVTAVKRGTNGGQSSGGFGSAPAADPFSGGSDQPPF